MLSRTGTYALQATLYLAANSNGRAVPTSEIAERLEAPADYLAKVLRELRRHGLLTSTRGAHGGYRLALAPPEMTVADVVEPFDGFEAPKSCPPRFRSGRGVRCTAHARRLEWIEAQRKILRETTVADLLTNETNEAAVVRSLDR